MAYLYTKIPTHPRIPHSSKPPSPPKDYIAIPQSGIWKHPPLGPILFSTFETYYFNQNKLNHLTHTACQSPPPITNFAGLLPTKPLYFLAASQYDPPVHTDLSSLSMAVCLQAYESATKGMQSGFWAVQSPRLLLRGYIIIYFLLQLQFAPLLLIGHTQ